ncbi:MAG TPA: hypothetical protein VJ739_19455 [Gemmataceae bacterium]|nr:hypothetical protein [Gemmataceae bacterium]
MTRKKARLLFLLLLGLGLAGACLVVWLSLSGPSYPIDPAGYDAIRKGMAKADVEARLGVKSGYRARRGNPYLMTLDGDVDQSNRKGVWIGNRYAILVEYDEQDRVQAKQLCRVTWLDPVRNALLHLGHRAGLW